MRDTSTILRRFEYSFSSSSMKFLVFLVLLCQRGMESSTVGQRWLGNLCAAQESITSETIIQNQKKKKKMGKPKGRDDSSSLKNPHSKASINLRKKEREDSNQKVTAKLNKLRGCFSSDYERAAKKNLMDLMTFLEGSTIAQLKERKEMRSKQTEMKDEMKSMQTEVKDKFVMICEEFIDGNHPTKILHKSFNQ